MYTTLEIERADGIGTIWMNRPEVHNAFDETLIDELSRAARELGDDDSVRVVVLGGRGKHFSAGADLNWMKRAAGNGPEENLRDARRFAGMLNALHTLNKPVIARVQGAALGGGTGLTAACAIAVASDDALFATSEVQFGILPSVISPYMLRAIGERQARRYFLTAERIPAARALEIGLVHRVIPRAELDAEVTRIASEAASLVTNNTKQ